MCVCVRWDTGYMSVWFALLSLSLSLQQDEQEQDAGQEAREGREDEERCAPHRQII